MSTEEWRSFWIRITSEGLIQVGKQGEEIPFMFWQDAEPLYVRYFSFCTWIDIFGLWAYDCPSDENDKETNSTEVKIQMTPIEKLKQDLFSNYDPFATPLYAIQFKTLMRIICWHVDLVSLTT